MRGVRARVTGVVLLGLVLLLGACGDRTTSPAAGTFTPRAPGTLTVVTTDVPSPGFWEGTAARPTGGFEYELVKQFATRFGLHTVRVETESFHRIVEGKLGGADMALDLITPTTARSEHLDFSTAYLNTAPTVVARKGTDVPDLETARGLRWGAVRGTTFVGIIQSLIAPSAPVHMYDDNSAMVDALEDGQIDALLLDLPLAVVTAERSDGRLHATAQLPQSELIAVALPKDSSNTQAVNSAINAFTNDGTIDSLLQRWVGPAAANAQKSIPLIQTTR